MGEENNLQDEQGNLQEQQTEEKATFTKEYVASLVASEIQKALDKQNKKNEKEAKKQRSLENLDEEQRAKAMQEQRIAELEEEVAKHRLLSTKNEIAKVLDKRGLSIELVDFVVTTDDEDECIEKIETLEKIFKQMVKDEVNKRLKSTAPKNANTQKETVLTKETFKKMTLAEQQQLYVTNKELYEELSKKWEVKLWLQ